MGSTAILTTSPKNSGTSTTHVSDFITTPRYITNKNSPDKGDIISMPINQQLRKRRLRIMIGETIGSMPK